MTGFDERENDAALLWSILVVQGGTLVFRTWRQLSGLTPARFLAAFNALGLHGLIQPGDVRETLEDGSWVALRDPDEGQGI